MSRRAPCRPPRRAPLKILQRFTPKGDDHLLSEIQHFAKRGCMVRVCRWRMPFFHIVQNGTQFLVLPGQGSPIGTFENIVAAVSAGDEHVEGSDEDDFDGLDPRGAA